MATASLRESLSNVHSITLDEQAALLAGFRDHVEAELDQRWTIVEPDDEPTFVTISGRHVSLLTPQPDSIDLHDIGCALANLVRFSGHVSEFWSVADHSLLVSRLVDPELALAGLLHDAPEAFLADIPSPVKKLMRMQGSLAYQECEARLWGAICIRFKMRLTAADMVKVKRADDEALSIENRDIANGRLEGLEEPRRDHAAPSKAAREQFIARAQMLLGGPMPPATPPRKLAAPARLVVPPYKGSGSTSPISRPKPFRSAPAPVRLRKARAASAS